ncbi:MAG TPA: hypothetical protein VIV60_12090 [Polyangiaceae bacterium]
MAIRQLQNTFCQVTDGSYALSVRIVQRALGWLNWVPPKSPPILDAFNATAENYRHCCTVMRKQGEFKGNASSLVHATSGE